MVFFVSFGVHGNAIWTFLNYLEGDNWLLLFVAMATDENLLNGIVLF